MSLNILINASVCVIGGGVQAAVGFIRHALAEAESRSWRLTLVVSTPVALQCAEAAANRGVTLHTCEVSPASLWAGRHIRQLLREVAGSSKADVVFTVFGPSYVRFDVPEMMGFADGFAITSEPGCYRNHGIVAAQISRFKSALKLLALRTAQAYWVETDTARRGLIQRARVPSGRVAVIPNGVNALFAEALRGREPATTGDILLLGASYPHKNHRLIPAVVRLLSTMVPLRPWRFVVTLPPSAPEWIQIQSELRVHGLETRCTNAGVLDLAGCAAACEAASVIFHPSLLEIFSATYVEAMAARRPLVVSDRQFAHEICGDAALYFDPMDAQSAAETIARVLTDSCVRARLVSNGIERLKSFPDSGEKNKRLCDLIDSFAKRDA